MATRRGHPLSSMAPPPPRTIGEVRARAKVSRARIIIGTTLLVCLVVAAGFFIMRLILSTEDPTLLARVPWILPLWILWGVYLSLAIVIRSYAYLYLPRTPVAVDEVILGFWVILIGTVVLYVMEVIVVGVPVEDERIVMSCTGVVAAFIVALLAFWVWLVRSYGGPADKPTDARAGIL